MALSERMQMLFERPLGSQMIDEPRDRRYENYFAQIRDPFSHTYPSLHPSDAIIEMESRKNTPEIATTAAV